MTKRCVFCSTLNKDLMDLPKADRQKLQDAKSPLYRWTIRSTAKNRDSKGSVTVSFRSLQQKRSHDEKSTQQASLVGTLNPKNSSSTQNQHSTRTFYLFPEDDLAHIPAKDELGFTTNPSINGGHQIKKWIQDCDHNPSTIHLIKTADENIKGPYITLSHCWGPRTKENEFLTLQGETEEEYKTKGLKLTALSINFQQAISVARFIGMRYIWIDSLCIIQGPASDFGTEGQLMHKVYRNSYCNLAAADSVDSRGGLFRTRKPADILPGRYRGDGRSAIFGTTAWMVVPENLWDADLLGTNIYTRGWVFQERMLSPRFWSSSVLRYTKCDLTNQADKTVAIWSIAKLVRDAWSDEYGAGMWGTALEEQLGWRVVDMKKSKRSVDLQWRQPSWSWTSVQGAVLAGERVAVERCYRVRGHDGKAISFKTKGLKRPAAEREHSDSLKEDLEIGWEEWQMKRRTQSSSQTTSAKSTTTDPKKYAKTALGTNPRDIEPELASKSIAIHAPIGSGSLHSNTETGTYSLKVKINTGGGVNTTTPQDTSREITLEAFPDELPSNLDLSPHPAHFLVLAATAHATPVSSFGLGLDLDEYDSDNEPEVPIHTTYSGIGILLIQSEEYLRRGAFRVKIKEAAKRINDFFVEKGTIQKGSSEEWTVRGLNSEMEHLMRLIVQLEWHKGTAEQHRHFRRTGSFQFRDLDEEAYAEIMGRQAVKSWLD
ncbi:HET-domain-containing protein [Zopfia rhizophila CBS 207.26]|uniref:HET-domain-containing protein n=1 Tax=Zopfia rhizophila CBS 207.26 TaxID=1314779 RepID=A0A6A6EIC4_9PEZI|nr:HET-domain-containing protein [Zopfia rhizophila CBS 207.26]